MILNPNSYIYVANPYSNADKMVMRMRAELVIQYAAYLYNKNVIVFSPIAHGEAVALKYDLPTDYAYWKASCEAFISHCKAVYVLCLEGWRESTGVTAEIKFAKGLGIEVKYVDSVTYKFIEGDNLINY